MRRKISERKVEKKNKAYTEEKTEKNTFRYKLEDNDKMHTQTHACMCMHTIYMSNLTVHQSFPGQEVHFILSPVHH